MDDTRFYMQVLGIFAGIAVFPTLMGIYGVQFGNALASIPGISFSAFLSDFSR
jgi:hypothetical protein